MGWDGWLVAAEAVVGVGLGGYAAWPRRSAGTSSFLLVADDFKAAERTQSETWAASPERGAFMSRLRRVNAAFAGSLFVLTAGLTLAVRLPAERDYGVELAVAGLLMLLGSFVPIGAARGAFRARQKAVAASRVDAAIGELAKHDHLTLGNLLTLNRRQLDQYQDLTRRQQRSAFRLTQITSLVAFGALIAGVVFTFTATSTTDKFLSGGLAALGSALSAFLASTFFKAHKQANDQLNRYYVEPEHTGRLLAAERLAQLDPALDKEVLTSIVTSLMSWESPRSKPPSPKAPAGSSNGATAPTG